MFTDDFLVCSVLVDPDGNPVTEITDEAIPVNAINQLRNLQVVDGLTLEDAVTFVRQKLVPDGYQPYPFRADTPESLLDKLRSIVATYRFRHRVGELKRQGLDFSTFLYIPEVDPITNDTFHEREDHCHILKRIWKHTREGRIFIVSEETPLLITTVTWTLSSFQNSHFLFYTHWNNKTST